MHGLVSHCAEARELDVPTLHMRPHTMPSFGCRMCACALNVGLCVVLKKNKAPFCLLAVQICDPFVLVEPLVDLRTPLRTLFEFEQPTAAVVMSTNAKF